MTSIVVTVADTTDDVTAAADIWTRAVAHRDGTEPATVDAGLVGIRRRLALDGATLLMARREGLPVGFALTAPRPETLEIFYLAVDPGVWGNGVAGGLLRAVDDHARAIGRTALELWVIDDNDRAIGVYERAGWARTDDLQLEPGSRPERRLIRHLPES